MSASDQVIGQSIISNSSGIGEIVAVMSLQEGGEEFYKVEFPQQKSVNYFSVNNQTGYRVLAPKKTIEKAVKIFKSDNEKIEYPTVQERINSQKELLKESDICKLAKTLSILNADKEMHAQISKAYKNALKTFTEEVGFVLELKQSEVSSLLGIPALK